jgi:hypothetical protein
MRKLLLCSYAAVLMPLTLLAGERIEEYKPNIKLGDGKNGRSAARWVQNTAEEPVTEVRAKLRRVSGDNKTFINLRFGMKGKTLDGSKRIYLDSDKVVTVSWNVGNVAPHGQPLVMIAYDGEVFVEYITVRRR